MLSKSSMTLLSWLTIGPVAIHFKLCPLNTILLLGISVFIIEVFFRS
jgi:hypothetical protein